ncbi:MAG: hypothetical protein OXT51_07345 [Chloroflexota bacterium]|nr:hypothetical protein [Chloroflexota bacterium]
MAQVAPYHDEDARIYHFYDDCTVGSRMMWDKKEQGKGERAPCSECSRRAMAELQGPGMHP